MPLRLLVVAATGVLILAAAGCGSSASKTPEHSPAGDIPDNQAYVAYHPPGSGYSVKVPEGWARTITPGGITSFTDKLNRVQMQQQTAPAALSAAQARSKEVPALAGTVKGFKAPRVSTVTRGAGQAVRITYLAASPPDPVTGKSHTDAVERYVFFHRGHSVVLTLSGPKGADNVDPWKIVTGSLAYTT